MDSKKKIISATLRIFLTYYHHLPLRECASIAFQNFNQTVRLLMLYVVEGNPLPVEIEFCKKMQWCTSYIQNGPECDDNRQVYASLKAHLVSVLFRERLAIPRSLHLLVNGSCVIIRVR